jgi:hypothetical protein
MHWRNTATKPANWSPIFGILGAEAGFYTRWLVSVGIGGYAGLGTRLGLLPEPVTQPVRSDDKERFET